MIALATVEGNDRGFDEFTALLEAEYPLTHAKLALETVTDRGLLFHWKGESAERPIILMAHYDVVPAEADTWSEDPFSGSIHDGAVWGRGALDDKGPLLVVIEAVENLLAAGYTPAHDVYLAFGGNEETYGSAAVAMSDLLRERGIEPWLIIDEGGAIVDAPLSFVPVQSAMVGLGEKGIATIRLTVDGTGGHASAPPASSAAGRLARALRRLERNPFAARMPRPFREMLRAYEPHVSLGQRLLLKTLRMTHGLTARILASRGGEPAALVHTTLAVTMLEGGTAANVLPSSLSAVLNLRIAQSESIESVVSTLKKAIRDEGVRIEVLAGSEPTDLSATDNEQFALIRSAVDATYPGTVTAPYVLMAATDARHFQRWAPAVYRFSPLAMTAEQRAAIHGADEHVTIDSLERGERFFQHLIQAM